MGYSLNKEKGFGVKERLKGFGVKPSKFRYDSSPQEFNSFP
jgi:hypothetical protein